MNLPYGSSQAAAPALVISTAGLQVGRRIGPLAWMTLQYLALSSHFADGKRAAPVGVRDVAEGVGVTKDTAARAISTLTAAGLVTRDRVEASDGRRRSGYVVHLPGQIQLTDCPIRPDSGGDRSLVATSVHPALFLERSPLAAARSHHTISTALRRSS